jgi:hypothetical protein
MRACFTRKSNERQWRAVQSVFEEQIPFHSLRMTHSARKCGLGRSILLFIILGLFPFLFSVTQADEGAVASDYHSWTAYRSARYPLVIYSQENKSVPEEVLFRAEEAMGSFEKDYPGFHFHLDQPIEVPLAWDAPQHFQPIDSNDYRIVPLPISETNSKRADQSSLSEATSILLEAELRMTTGRTLPDWFCEFILSDWKGSLLETGSGPVFQINPGDFSKMILNGNFRTLQDMTKATPGNPVLYFDHNPAFARWLSSCMYVLYAQQAPSGRSFQADLTAILIAAQSKEEPAGSQTNLLIKRLLQQTPDLTKAVKDYWAARSPEECVLAQNLEASARLWASLATLADQAGTRYPTFNELAAAVKNDTIPLPANAPRSLVRKANMFLDRDGFYELSWDGPTAVIREVAREGFGFEIHAHADNGFVETKVERFNASSEDMAKLPNPDANPFHSDHYLIFTDGKPEDTSDILLQADLFYKRLTAELPWPQPPRHARLVMYYYVNAWESGLFQVNYYLPMIGVIYVSPQGDDTMRHEMVHQIVDFSAKGRFALWFNEAIAEYYGRHIAYAGDGFVGPLRIPYEVENIQSYLAGKWEGQWGEMTLPQLVHLDPDAWSALRHGPYTFAWSIVYYMIHGDNGAHRTLFDDYMKATAAGTGDAKARDEAFDAAAMKLEPGWRAYWSGVSSHADETCTDEAHVRLVYLFLQEGLRQGLTKITTEPESVDWLIEKHELKTAPLRVNRITNDAADGVSRQLDWKNTWKAQGTGNEMRLSCTYPNGTKIEVWHDAMTNQTMSRAVLSAAALSWTTKPTLPGSSSDVAGGNQSSGATQAPVPQPPAVGAGSFPPSAPHPAVAPGSFPPFAPRPAVAPGSFPPSAPRPAVAPGSFSPLPPRSAAVTSPVPPCAPVPTQAPLPPPPPAKDGSNAPPTPPGVD